MNPYVAILRDSSLETVQKGACGGGKTIPKKLVHFASLTSNASLNMLELSSYFPEMNSR